MSFVKGPQTLREATLIPSDAVKDETEDVSPESDEVARANKMTDEKDPDEQETKS